MLSLVLPALLSLHTASAATCEGGSPDIKGWSVTRETTVHAPAEVTWAFASDFNEWPDWTNWGRERDPEAEWTIEGEPGTAGHSTSWDGPELKTGGMSATAAEGMCMVYDLRFGKSTDNRGYIVVSEAGEDTSKVTWHSAGKMGGMSRMFFRKAAEKAIGADFDAGLVKLDVRARKAFVDQLTAEAQAAKATAEASAKAAEEATAAAATKQAEVETAAAAVEGAQAALDKARRRSAKKEAQAALDAAKEQHSTAEAAAEEASGAASKAQEQAKADAEAAAAVAARLAKATGS